MLTSKSAGDSPKSPLKRQDIQLCTILNTVKRQFTHTKKDDILCTSNFSMYIFSNSEARIQTFLHLTKPDSIVFHSYITLWLIVAQRSLHCKATVFVVRVFSFLKFKTNLSISCLEIQDTVFVIACELSVSLIYWKNLRSILVCRGNLYNWRKSISQWFLTVLMAWVEHKIVNDHWAADCFIKIMKSH